MEQSKKNNCIRYAELLAQAYATTSRKEAIQLIHQADKLRMEITQDDEHPVCYG
jgi:hypothetical protein